MFLHVLGCNGPYPAPGGACSGYLLESDSGKTKIVLDLGSGTLSRLCALCDPASEIDAVILSHLHYDHMSDVTVLGYLLDFSPRETIKLVCPDTPADVRKLIKGKFDVYPPKDFTLGEFDIQFMRVKHPVETYAVKVTCDQSIFVYTGDTNECAEIDLFAFGADTILADAGLSRQDWMPGKPHMHPALCAKLAKNSKADQLILTHLSPRYDSGELLDEARAVFTNTYLAEPDMRIRV